MLLEEHFHNYVDTKLGRNYDVVAVNYHKLWEEGAVDQLAVALNIEPAVLRRAWPERKARCKSPLATERTAQVATLGSSSAPRRPWAPAQLPGDPGLQLSSQQSPASEPPALGRRAKSWWTSAS
jgi:hypothetical protein